MQEKKKKKKNIFHSWLLRLSSMLVFYCENTSIYAKFCSKRKRKKKCHIFLVLEHTHIPLMFVNVVMAKLS